MTATAGSHVQRSLLPTEVQPTTSSRHTTKSTQLYMHCWQKEMTTHRKKMFTVKMMQAVTEEAIDQWRSAGEI